MLVFARFSFQEIVFIFLQSYILTTYIEREKERKKFKKQVIQSEEFNEKESRRSKVLVLMNHHQEFRKDDIDSR